MKLLTREQSQNLDSFAIDKCKISGIDLMNSAGEKVAETVKYQIGDDTESKILILCGKGNNGGDGFAAATYLKEEGYNIEIHSLVEQDSIKTDSRYFFERCVALSCPISFGMEPDDLSDPDIIVDGILGTGFRKKLRPEILPWIEWINERSAFVIAIDIPSGLDCDTGQISPNAVIANKTIAMGYNKVGMLLMNGKDHSGSIEPVDIGHPKKESFSHEDLQWSLFNEKEIPNILKNIRTHTYKHKQGKVLIIAGSKGMTGAAVLATFGALRSGAGMTITCAPASLNSIYEKYILEGMTLSCSDEDRGYFTMNNLDQIIERSDWADSVIIGPGIGTNAETMALAKALIESINKPVILDADGLKCFRELQCDLEKLIVTPHLGEFSSMIDQTTNDIKSDFVAIVNRFMSGFNGTALIKHVPACIFHGTQVSLNSSGNPALATAGTGDVLSGILGTFRAQGMIGYDAARLGAYFHGEAGDQLSSSIGKRGMIASDLPKAVASIIKKYE